MNINFKKLQIVQAKACLSINEIVEKTNLAKSTVSRIFNGSTNPTAKSIGLIAKALDIDVTELLIDGE